MNVGSGVASLALAPAPFGLPAGKEAEPGMVLGAIPLGMRRWSRERRLGGPLQPARHLFWGPSGLQQFPQVWVPVHGAAPTTGPSLVVGRRGCMREPFRLSSPRLSMRSKFVAIWPIDGPSHRSSMEVVIYRSQLVLHFVCEFRNPGILALWNANSYLAPLDSGLRRNDGSPPE